MAALIDMSSPKKWRLKYVLFDPRYGCENSILWLWEQSPKVKRQHLFRALRDFGAATLASNQSKAQACALAFGRKWMLRPSSPPLIADLSPVRIAVSLKGSSPRIREELSCGIARLATMDASVLIAGLEKMQRQDGLSLRVAEMMVYAQAILQSSMGAAMPPAIGSSDSHSATAPVEQADAAKQQDTTTNKAPHESPSAARRSDDSSASSSSTQSGTASKTQQEPAKPAPTAALQATHAVEEETLAETAADEEETVDWGSIAGFGAFGYEG